VIFACGGISKIVSKMNPYKFKNLINIHQTVASFINHTAMCTLGPNVKVKGNGESKHTPCVGDMQDH
jgi:hypothetical protein